MPSWYADVAPAIPLPVTGPQVYTYRVPDGMVAGALVYTQVTIPFGKRRVRGVVIRVHQERVPYPIKELALYAPWQLTAHQVAWGTWIHQTMGGGLGYTLRLFFPPGVTPRPTWHRASVAVAKGRARKPRAIIESDTAARHQRIASLIAPMATTQALIIVPEKWLIAPLAATMTKHFPGRVVTIEASASSRQATSTWERVQTDGQVIIIGTQKSLFLPFQSLRLVVVEEEFYATHKLWDQYPRLDNRLGAQQLARIHRASLVYATSFPSLRLWHEIAARRIRAVIKKPLQPQTNLIAPTFDDRQHHRVLPQLLIASMKTWVAHKKRIVMLHNVLGSWRVVLCRSCHTTVRCPDCGMAMAVHGTGSKARLVCHHCGATRAVPTSCPQCHKETLTTFGAGTERVSEVLRQIFPTTPLQVMEAVSEALPPAAAAGAQIIIGTTALFTRLPHHWADQTVYLFPERGLLYPDFRSEERVLLTLVRLAQLGQAAQPITIVTHKKPLVAARLTAAPATLLRKMITERDRLGYPPLQDMVRLTWRSSTAALARRKAATVRGRLEECDTSITIRGPFASFHQMTRGKYEQHLLLLGPLDRLRQCYAAQPIDAVDVWPERIL